MSIPVTEEQDAFNYTRFRVGDIYEARNPSTEEMSRFTICADGNLWWKSGPLRSWWDNPRGEALEGNGKPNVRAHDIRKITHIRYVSNVYGLDNPSRERRGHSDGGPGYYNPNNTDHKSMEYVCVHCGFDYGAHNGTRCPIDPWSTFVDPRSPKKAIRDISQTAPKDDEEWMPGDHEAGVVAKDKNGTIIRVGDFVRYDMNGRVERVWQIAKSISEPERARIRFGHFRSWQLDRFYVKVDGPTSERPVETTKEKDVSVEIKIETKTYVNGQDFKSLGEDEQFDMLSRAEREIVRLKEIKAQPKRLKNRIAKLEGQIADMVKLMDETNKD